MSPGARIRDGAVPETNTRHRGFRSPSPAISFAVVGLAAGRPLARALFHPLPWTSRDRTSSRRRRSGSWPGGRHGRGRHPRDPRGLPPQARGPDRRAGDTRHRHREARRDGARGPRLGTLVPEEIRWIPAVTQGRVERLVLLPGTTVTRGLGDPRARQPRARDAGPRRGVPAPGGRGALHRAARCASRASSSTRRRRRRGSGRVEAGPAAGGRRRRAGEGAASSPASTSSCRRARPTSSSTARASSSSGWRSRAQAIDAQLAVQQAEVDQRRPGAPAPLAGRGLQVRAGLAGVLQVVPVEVGQQVTPGTNLARVARPDRLKAVHPRAGDPGARRRCPARRPSSTRATASSTAASSASTPPCRTARSRWT